MKSKTELKNLSLAELKEIAKENGIKNISKMKKDDILFEVWGLTEWL